MQQSKHLYLNGKHNIPDKSQQFHLVKFHLVLT